VEVEGRLRKGEEIGGEGMFVYSNDVETAKKK